MAEPAVLYDERDGIARITLNRAARSNAFDLATAKLFTELVHRAAADTVRVVLISGNGPRFCAGGDLAAMAADGLTAQPLTELASTLDLGLQMLAALDKPVVAAVHGAVAGAGLGLLLSCDLAVAARSTKFLMAYDGVGLTPDCGVSYLLPRAIGQQRALQLALSGRVLSAEDALQWGLLATVVDDDQLTATAAAMVEKLAKKAPFALGQAKRLIRTSWLVTRQQSGQDEAATIGAAATTPDAQRLIAAFLDSRQGS